MEEWLGGVEDAGLAEAQPAPCRRALSGRSANAWDVIPSANQVILEKASEVLSLSDLVAWAYALVRFQVLARRKWLSRARNIFNLAVLDKTANHRVSHSAEFGERVRALEQYLQKLPARQREYFALRYDRDMPLSEIATRLNRAENAVAAILYRARSSLARCVEGKLAEEAAA